MAIVIKKNPDDLYEAEITPPHATMAWITPLPISLKQLTQELQMRGCHPQDIGDALYEIDPDWLSKL
jgi:hypothetical protein